MNSSTNKVERGFTLVEILIIVALISLIMGIAMPHFIRARRDSQASLCCENLEQLENAKSQWAFASNAGDNAVPIDADLSPYLSSNAVPDCPSNGAYALGTTGTETVYDPATCSLSVSPGTHAIR